MLPFDDCARLIARMEQGIAALAQASASLGLPAVQGREWFELLHRKLIPQLGAQSFLIVGVVGGTNIGKSVLFNHIAGARLSASSPLASGTRHPLALVPRKLADQLSLPELFPGFEVRPWENAQQPLEDCPEHWLYYRVSDETPERLVILDTPDVDSVAVVNWERADAVRQAADVLIAVLTQQKYNDAAVKEFFRKAAQEGKLVIVVFNQCQLPEDEEYWPLWLETFCRETGVAPHSIYIVPNDRAAAEAIRLLFYERRWPTSNELPADPSVPRSLLRDLAELRFGEIKVQALSGALRQLTDPGAGIPHWLQEIAGRGREYQEACGLMSGQRLVEVSRWPTLPNGVLISHIRQWWSAQRSGWSAAVHGFYSRLGQAVAVPVRFVRQRSGLSGPSPVESYRAAEWDAVLEVLDRSLERLTWLRDLGNPLLSPRLERLLGGASRAELLETLRKAHEAIDFDEEVRQLVAAELAGFREESPGSYQFFRRVDSAVAAVKPAISVALFLTGAGPAGDLLAPLAADSALQGMLHVTSEAAGGAVTTVVGDQVLATTASTGAGYIEAKFRRLHAAFAGRRAAWMAQQLDNLLLGSLPADLAAAAQVSQTPAYREVAALVGELADMLQR